MRRCRWVVAVCALTMIAACSSGPTSDQSREVMVQPNPATEEALQELQELYPNASDPTGFRVIFSNLPSAPCDISVFDQSGELLVELQKNDARTSRSWGLGSQAGTSVGTGTYHFAVHLKDGTFIDSGTLFVSR